MDAGVLPEKEKNREKDERYLLSSLHILVSVCVCVCVHNRVRMAWSENGAVMYTTATRNSLACVRRFVVLLHKRTNKSYCSKWWIFTLFSLRSYHGFTTM